MPFSCCANFYDSSRPLELEHCRCLWAAVMEQDDSDDESVTPTLPGFVRASKPPAPPGFVRPASSRTKKKASGADVAAAYRAEIRRPKPSSAAPAPAVAVVGPARMATCAAVLPWAFATLFAAGFFSTEPTASGAYACPRRIAAQQEITPAKAQPDLLRQ